MKKAVLVFLLLSFGFLPGEVASEERWGAFVYVMLGSKDYYSVSWNYPSESQAFEASIKECTKTIGTLCWPRREVNSGEINTGYFWVPNHVTIFSTSSPHKRNDGVDGGAVLIDRNNYIYQIKARCLLIYQNPSNGRYIDITGDTKEEVEAKFRQERKKDLEYYGYKYPPLVSIKTVCNAT